MLISEDEIVQVMQKALDLAELNQLTFLNQSIMDSSDNSSILREWKKYRELGVKSIGLYEMRLFNFLDKLSKAIIAESPVGATDHPGLQEQENRSSTAGKDGRKRE